MVRCVFRSGRGIKRYVLSGVIRVCFQPTLDGKFTSIAYPKATIANPNPETKAMLSCSTKKSVHTEKDQEGIVFKSDGGMENLQFSNVSFFFIVHLI